MMPFLRRTIVEPLHCMKNASRKLHYWKELEETQFLGVERLL